jgi:SAM-dependent methyltransferase
MASDRSGSLAGSKESFAPYTGLADEYGTVLGALAQRTWRQGILADVARLHPDPSTVVVDLGAGTGIGGRLLATVMTAPYRVGIDASRSMLRHAGDAYERVEVADLRRLPLDTASAGLVVSGFDTLNYLDAAGLAGCLAEAARCLTESGWLIFDYSSPQLLRGMWREHSDVDELPDVWVLWRHPFDPPGQRCVSTVERRDRSGAVWWRETHVQYAVDTYELHTLAAAVGLRVDRVRDLHRDQFSPAAHTQVWILRKEA